MVMINDIECTLIYYIIIIKINNNLYRANNSEYCK